MQQPRERSRGFALFRSQTLEDIPQTYSWFAEMRTQHPVFYEERIRLWQVFRCQEPCPLKGTGLQRWGGNTPVF